MGMLEDQAGGLTPEETDKARALYMHSIDPENNPDPDAPEPIPMFHPGEEPGVQPEGAYTNNVQDEIVDEEEDPFAEAEYAEEGAAPEEPQPAEDVDDPFAEAELTPEGYVPDELDDPDNPFDDAELETPPEPPMPEPEPEPEEEGGFIDAGIGGIKKMWNAVKTETASLFGDAEAVERLAAESQGIEGTKAQEEFMSAFQENMEQDETLIDGISNVLSAAYDEPLGAAHEVTAQAGNMLPILGGAYAGLKVGAASGAVVGGPVGAVIGGVVGSVAGMFAGNMAIEGGFAQQEEALKPGVITQEQMSEANIGAAKKAGVITGIDMITMGANRLMMGAPGRTATAAVNKHLVSKGVDVADEAAVRAALEGSEELLGEVMEISAETLAKSTGSIIGKRGVRGAAGMGLETVGEGTGEYLGTLASGKDASFSEAALEAFMAGPTSAAELAFVSTYKTAKSKLGQLGPTKDAAAALEEESKGEEIQGPLPATREQQEAQLETQAEDAAGRAQDIENAQDSARERVLANGGDLLDAELEASKVGADMGQTDDEIQRHLNMVNRQTEGALTKREEEEKAKVKDLKTTVKETKKAAEEDKAYEQKDKVSGIGQTGDVGHIAADTGAAPAVAGKEGEGVVRGNQLAEAFARAANESATSPENNLTPPTPAQKEAGNYKKGHQRINGLDVTIENPAGSTREAADGSWKQDMKDHYGYIKGTESAEGKTEQLDVFVGENLESKEVFVVDQINKDGVFDEHKVMMGYGNAIEARRAYARNYPQGFRVGKITKMSVPKFKEWLKNGDQTQPVQPTAKAGGPSAASASQPKEVIQPKTLDGGRTTRTLTAAEQAEQRIEQMPGRKVRYRLGTGEAKTPDRRLQETKITDEEGVPLVVYRGVDATREKDTLGGRMPTYTPSKYIAGDYAADHDEGMVGSYRLNIKNPLDLSRGGDDAISIKDIRNIFSDLTPEQSKMLDAALEDMDNWRGWAESPMDDPYVTAVDIEDIPDEGYTDTFELADSLAFVELAKAKGHDGIIIHGPFNPTDEAGAIPDEEVNRLEMEGEVEFRPFSEDQVISEMDKVPGTREHEVAGKKVRYRLDDKVDSKELRTRLNNEGDGFTVDNKTGKDKKTGFAAGQGKEKVFAKRPTAKQIESYRKQHAVALAEEGNYLGAWVYQGEYFLDVSKVYPNNDMGRKRAYADAKSRGEFGIQDLSKTPEEGYIGIEYKPGEREAARKKGIRYRKEEADGDKYFDERAWKDAESEASGNSRTTIVHITPDQFLRMAETLTRPDEQKAREVDMLMEEEVAFNSMPVLIFQNQGQVAKTTGHEGRHRAMALKARGVKSMPVRLISGEGAQGAIRFNYHEGAVPSTMEGQSGGVMKFPWSPEPAAAAEEAPHEGRAFKNFFSAVTKGLTGTSSTGAAYKPVIPAVATAMGADSPIQRYSKEYIKHRGKFDDHIAFSIPGYKEVQQAVGAALAQNYTAGDSMLDIGASEGSFAKAVTALSGMESTSLDPNPDMQDSFNEVSSVPGAEYSMTALGAADQEGETAWTEEDGTEIPYFDPMGKKYDVVHEAMVFQFVSNERTEQFARVAELVADNGLFITEEKVFTPNQKANEDKKNKDHKALYFEKKDLDAKSAEVLEGMHQNMVHDFKLEEELARNFKYVMQFWDSGNFKGYMASNSMTTLNNAINSMPSLKSDFSTTSTPRVVSGTTRKRIGGNEKVNVPMTSAKAKEVLAPYVKKMPLLQPQILANPSEAPAALYNQMQKDGALKAKGVFDPETGKLYVFSENHDSDADVVRTLLHEGVAHKGLRYLLGDKFEDTMNDVFKNGEQEAMARIARKYGLDPGNAEDIVEIAEEYVAYLAEHGVQSTVLQRVIAAVRQALRSVGVVKKWSDADLHALLARSGRKLKGKPMRKAMITKSFVIEGTGEQVEIEVSADVEMRNIAKRKEACEKVRKCIK